MPSSESPQGTLTHPPGGFTQAEWDNALPWSVYLEQVDDKRDVWDANWRRAKVDANSATRLRDLPGKRRVLVLTEDWCGDAARSIPPLARALADAPQVDARYLLSDAHPDVLGRYLSHGGRGIPIVIVQDERGRELGAWGPRPAPLQALFRERRREFGAPTPDTMADLYAPIMRWYAQDKGRTVVEEILMLLERGGTPR